MKSIDTGKKFKFDYKWIIVVLCFLMVMVGLGFGSSTKSLFPDEISKELGIPRSLIVIGDSCRYISTAVVNVFFGTLIAKFGPKKLICAGFVSLTAAAVIMRTRRTSLCCILQEHFSASDLLGPARR